VPPQPDPGDTDRIWPAVVVGSLDRHELAVALYASDMPTRRAPWSARQLAEFAMEGVGRICLAAVRERAQQALRLNLVMLAIADRLDLSMIRARHPAFAANERAQRRLWPSARREVMARDMAYRLHDALRSGAAPDQQRVSRPGPADAEVRRVHRD
jgi:hypothetical protein